MLRKHPNPEHPRSVLCDWKTAWPALLRKGLKI
ncbi:hypothetical protein A6R68_06856 [Neotoma lepida]|uniref:Uncharacterized protein n=1 Tax=Neotoma lepida TaxID=56216 RepID=A0A1A6GEE1_NEOLE|nr:hypothetical protein A6R68_06856 [Neotoma lepida]